MSPADDSVPSQPLAGRSVVVTRAASQSSELTAALRQAGADVVELAMIDIVPSPENSTTLASRLADIDGYDWLIVTSPNGASCVCAHASQPPKHCQVAAIGAATAAALAPYASSAFIPKVANANGFLDEFESDPPRKALLIQGDLASPLIADRLLAAGWSVDRVVAYSTVAATPDAPTLVRAAAADAVTFMSGSAVNAYVEALGVHRLPPVVISIGPSTTATLSEFGVLHVYQAALPTVPAMLQTVFSALQ